MAGKFSPLEFETKLTEYWTKNTIRQKAKNKNVGNKKFYFLQGPPYTSGRLHMGHAWNHSLKDIVLRYKRMAGFHVWDRAGYDMHGLPTEHKVLKKLGIEGMEQIQKFGEEKFCNECYSFCTEMMNLMNVDLQRLGITLDFSQPYQPITNSYIEGVWALVKKAHESGRLYKGKRTMMWCVPFATALAKHETVYKSVTDNSVFVKFLVEGTTNEYLLVWTTTPWTLPFNLAIMVNPEVEYAKVSVVYEGKKEVWIIAQALAGVFLNTVVGLPFEIIHTMTGEKLAGLKYRHFWLNKIPALASLAGKYSALHTVILSTEYVDTTAGTGLVHCAPGCGPEDYEVGLRNGLIAFNEIDERAVFSKNCGFAAGKIAKTDDSFFIETLKADGVLIASTPVTHDYPFCERSDSPVVFRTTEQWFFKIEDLKKELLEFYETTNWVPPKAGNAFKSWLSSLRDNSITKQRFWGTPAPIWVCDKTGHVVVIGSIAELAQRLGDKTPIPPNLHKPYIDALTFPSEFGGTYRRIPDVLDVWIDAGSASWNCLDYLQNPRQFFEWFPADFILEGKDQVRGWFNLLAVTGMIMFGKKVFENVYMHGFLSGIDGQKMSKSLGNVLSPFEIIDKYGADTLRSYTSKIRPGEDIAFSWDEIKQNYRNVSMLYNMSVFLQDTIINAKLDPKTIDCETVKSLELGIEEKYILSVVEQAIEQITVHYDSYQLYLIAPVYEDAVARLSRDYIQFCRNKVAEDPLVVAATLYRCLYRLIQIAHPVIPFTTEHIYLELQQFFSSHIQANNDGNSERDKKTHEEDKKTHDEIPADTFHYGIKNVQTVHKDFVSQSLLLHSFPISEAVLIKKQLVTEIDVANDIIQTILAAREKANCGVRWPLGNCTVVVAEGKEGREGSNLTTIINTLSEETKDLIKEQTNVKQLIFAQNYANVTYSIKPNYKSLAKKFGALTAQVSECLLHYPKVAQLVETVQKGSVYQLHLTHSQATDSQAKDSQATDASTRANNVVDICLDDVVIQTGVSEGIAFSESSTCQVYLEKELTIELEREGFARELMRRIQVLRKDSGLQKLDKITLTMRATKKIVDAFIAFEELIYKRCGVVKATTEVLSAKLEVLNPQTTQVNTSRDQIKNEQFELSISQV